MVLKWTYLVKIGNHENGRPRHKCWPNSKTSTDLVSSMLNTTQIKKWAWLKHFFQYLTSLVYSCFLTKDTVAILSTSPILSILLKFSGCCQNYGLFWKIFQRDKPWSLSGQFFQNWFWPQIWIIPTQGHPKIPLVQKNSKI